MIFSKESRDAIKG